MPDGTGIAKSQAESILEGVYGIYTVTSCPEINGIKGQRGSGNGTAISPDELSRAYGLSATAKPNPATVYVAFDYTLPADETEAEITITGAVGTVIDRLHVSGRQGQKVWDTRNVSNGVYLYTIRCNGFTQTGKFIISK